jgi:hypothetical protein
VRQSATTVQQNSNVKNRVPKGSWFFSTYKDNIPTALMHRVNVTGSEFIKMYNSYGSWKSFGYSCNTKIIGNKVFLASGNFNKIVWITIGTAITYLKFKKVVDPCRGIAIMNKILKQNNFTK